MRINCFKSTMDKDTLAINCELISIDDSEILELTQYKYGDSTESEIMQEKNFKDSGMRSLFDVDSDWVKLETTSHEYYSINKIDLGRYPQLKDRYKIIEV